MFNLLLWSTGAMVTGFALDMLFGDPYHFPHIVRLMGSLIAFSEKLLRRTFPQRERLGGVMLVVIVTLISTGVPLLALALCYRIYAPLYFVAESLLCYQLLAAKQLKIESMKVFDALRSGDLGAARYAVSMIVGRDTDVLDEAGTTRAAVETVAENASDGETAPLLLIALGGAAAGCFYKAVNTMDSMVGYKNEKYLHFGRAAARLDDALNLIPSRLCALLMIISAYFLRFDGKNAFRIWRRDRRNHASPNSAQTESACAGALGIRLAGPISYFGKMRDKPYIGDDTRSITFGDIPKANRLLYGASGLTLFLALIIRIGVMCIVAL